VSSENWLSCRFLAVFRQNWLLWVPVKGVRLQGQLRAISQGGKGSPDGMFAFGEGDRGDGWLGIEKIGAEYPV
jgi:hypothetical protein